MQKFSMGDLVQIDKDLGACSSHFTADCPAIVIGSYADQFGGDDTKSYTIYTENAGQASWYEEHQLTLIKRDQTALLRQWKEAAKQKKEQESDMDWIFEQGPLVLKGASEATLQTLATSMGYGNLWGSRGEGVTYYSNAMFILRVAKPFLEKHDKAGWEDFSKKSKLVKESYE